MTTPLILVINSTAADAPAFALNTPVAGTDAPEWVQLVPAGEFSGVDGRGPWRNADANAVIAASKAAAGAMDLPIDYGHAMEHELHGASAMGAEAAGWITDLENRGGEIWGKVEWTAAAAAKIRGRAFRGISPVFYHDAQGVVRCIARAGLTNTPNLRIKSLNAREGAQETSVTEAQFKAFRARLAATFGMPETSDDDALIARCSTALEAESAMTKVASSLTLAASATTADVVKAVQSAQEKVLAFDPSKYVPAEQHKAVCAELSTLKETQSASAVDAAIAAGKITPAQRPWAINYASQNRTAFDEFVAKAVPLVRPGAEEREQLNKGADVLTAGEKAICAQTGVSEADFLKTKKEGAQ